MGLKFANDEMSFHPNKYLAKLIQNNIQYLYEKFPNLKRNNAHVAIDDYGYLQFIASYCASENIVLTDDYLIVSTIEDDNKLYLFLDKEVCIFSFESDVNVKVLSFWQKISHTLNYTSLKHGFYFIENDGYTFLNSDFDHIVESVFEDTINPKISSVTVEFNFCRLNISVSNSNYKSIDSILSYFKN